MISLEATDFGFSRVKRKAEVDIIIKDFLMLSLFIIRVFLGGHFFSD